MSFSSWSVVVPVRLSIAPPVSTGLAVATVSAGVCFVTSGVAVVSVVFFEQPASVRAAAITTAAGIIKGTRTNLMLHSSSGNPSCRVAEGGKRILKTGTEKISRPSGGSARRAMAPRRPEAITLEKRQPANSGAVRVDRVESPPPFPRAREHDLPSVGRPLRILVRAGTSGQRDGAGSVHLDRPDLETTVPLRNVHDSLPVGRPVGRVVPFPVEGEPPQIAALGVTDVQLRTAGAVAGEADLLSGGRPAGRRVDGAIAGDPFRISSVRTGNEYLAVAVGLH